MAVQSPVPLYLSLVDNENHIWTDTWAMAAADTANYSQRPGAADKSVQVNATTWTGMTVVIQGSNDGVNWFTLNNALGSPLSFTANGLQQILENPLYIRPFVSVAGSGAGITVVLLSRGHS